MTPLPWHYLGYLGCLLSKPGYRDELAARLQDFPLEDVLRSATSDEPSAASESPLMQLVAEVASEHGRPEFPFDLAALSRFSLRIVRMPSEMNGHEILLTPDALYLPWPLFDGRPDSPDGPLADAAERHPPPTLALADLPEPYVAVRATYDALDYLVECRPAFRDDAENMGREEVRAAMAPVARQQGAHVHFGDFEVTFDPERWIGRSLVEVEDDALRLVEGLVLETPPDVAPPDEAAGFGLSTAAKPCWPCAVFHGLSRNCDDPTDPCP